MTSLFYFLALYAAHLCGDVLTYFPWLARAKRSEDKERKATAVLTHCLIHAGFVLLWFWLFNLPFALLAASYILLVHFTIDFCRVSFEKKLIAQGELVIFHKKEIFLWLLRREEGDVSRFMNNHFTKWASINIADQSMHLLAILGLVLLLSDVQSAP